MKIDVIKLGNAIKCGAKTQDFFMAGKGYEISLDGVVVRIVDERSKDETFTSLFNAVWWKAAGAKDTKDAKPGKGK